MSDHVARFLAAEPAPIGASSNRSTKRHLELTLALVAGCSPFIVRTLQSSNGLLADGGPPYSIADIAVVRTVVLLTGLGVAAQTAVDAAMNALPIFERLFADDAVDTSVTNIIAIYPTGRSEHFAYPRFAVYRAAEGACVIVDALTIAGHVLEELIELKPPIVVQADEHAAMMRKAVADAWMPKIETEPAPIGAPSRTIDRLTWKRS